MPTEKPRVTFTISREKLSELETYQHENKIKNQTQAILSLIDKGISDYLSEIKNTPPYSEEALKLAEDYTKRMDDRGRETVRGVADLEVARYKAAIQKERKEMEAAEEIALEVVFICPGFISPMSAGTGQQAGDEYPENYHLIKEPPRGTSYIAPVSGNSMEPTYQSGDKLFIHACTEIRRGQIGVFFMDGQQWIKELGDGELISHNEKYDPIPVREDIRCQGLVLGVCDESYFE